MQNNNIQLTKQLVPDSDSIRPCEKIPKCNNLIQKYKAKMMSTSALNAGNFMVEQPSQNPGESTFQ